VDDEEVDGRPAAPHAVHADQGSYVTDQGDHEHDGQHDGLDAGHLVEPGHLSFILFTSVVVVVVVVVLCGGIPECSTAEIGVKHGGQELNRPTIVIWGVVRLDV